METNRLKRFATEARRILMTGVEHRIASLGFRADGTAAEEPQLFGGGAVFMGETVSEDFYCKWQSLSDAIRRQGVTGTIEEVAYTWFNRLTAIRILTKNGLIPPVLLFESPGVYVPLIVSEARQGRLPQMSAEEESKLMPMLEDDSRTAEQFRLLITAFCHSTPLIHRCFGRIDDYTELLLPDNILAGGGFVDLLNHTDFITDEDYYSSELIGWLYQFYISEKKDQVMSGKGKYSAADIPAATQIFTPAWIVKYMVQNTVGRIYLDNNSTETEVAQDWKYLVNPSEPTPDDRILRYGDLTDLRLADLACGSGHILGEMFDMLYTLYINEGYSRREAIESIFRRNLTGIDIDTRAKQLSQFALLLKACQKDASFADCRCMPQVLDMPQPYPDKEHLTRTLADYIMADNGEVIAELADAVCLMDEADSLGSIMKFPLSERTRNILAVRTEEYGQQTMPGEIVSGLLPHMRIILALTEQYHALVMNPPYMGGGNMNAMLSNYVKKNYEAGKADLFSVFMQVCEERLVAYGKYGMINMQSWMFLSSFEKLRTHLLDTMQIDNMLHLGPRTFDELSGEVVQNTAFVLTKHAPYQTGTYYRLVDGKNCGDKERMFLAGENCYRNVSQQNFGKIPGSPIAYWASPKIQEIFRQNLALSAVCSPTQGLATADNARFLRLWFEVSQSRIGFGCENAASAARSQKKWFPCNKGGERRRWYGNQEEIIDWENNGKRIKAFKGAVIRNEHCYFKPSVSWNMVTSGGASFRYFPKGFILNNASNSINCDDLLGMLGYLNTPFVSYISNIINPTLNLSNGVVAKFPYLVINNDKYRTLVSQNISISKSDWDAHETSWDFEVNELVRLAKEGLGKITATLNGEVVMQYFSLELLLLEYKTHWTEQFLRLHTNEEELNRQFIAIYGLEDELEPDVLPEEITILQQGEIRIENGQIVWQNDVIVKQLISYAVGCMLGRYRLDKPGLHIAHPEPTAEETAPYIFNGQQWNIDEDGILPLMPSDTDFADNATVMFKRWLVMAFGEDTLVDNLNCVEAALGKSLDDYFVKDFWKDHKKMYQNRPIYWLFSSRKGAFQCLAYMHRMNAYTAERIRTKYLLPHIEWLVQKQSEMQANAASLNARERKQLDSIGSQIAECREYHDRLHTVADEQLAFDLDDGVVVNYGKFGDVLRSIK